MEVVILRLLYYSSPEPLSMKSLVIRIRAIQDRTTKPEIIEKEVHRTLMRLSREGLCEIACGKNGEMRASLTSSGFSSLAGGLDERLEVRKVPPIQLLDEPVPTGILGLDEILQGGIPPGSVVLIRGPPGSGKTILSAQFLHAGITRYDHNAVFISFDVARIDFLKQMKELRMDFEPFEGKQFDFVDAAPIRLVATDSRIQPESGRKGRVAVISLCDEIEKKAEQMKAKRIVIDTLTSLSMLYRDIVERRMGMLALFEALHKLGCTALVTAEVGQPGVVEPEEYLSDGVINLERILVGRAIVRAINVNKMRRREIDIQTHPFRITSTGIEVFARETVF
jgi:KaiC/GvpD/RAD55 family RecA-like ATPase